MGQIVSSAAKPKRCNLNKLSQLGTPAAGEYILVSSDNSMNAAGQGNFDCYIVGVGTTAATELPLHKFKAEELDVQINGLPADDVAFDVSTTAGSSIDLNSQVKSVSLKKGRQYLYKVLGGATNTLTMYFYNSSGVAVYCNCNGTTTKTILIKPSAGRIMIVTPIDEDVTVIKFYTIGSNIAETGVMSFSFHADAVYGLANIASYFPNYNLFEASSVLYRKGVSSSNGSVVDFEGGAASDFIAVEAGRQYTFSIQPYRIVFFDSNKNFVSSIVYAPAAPSTITAPAGSSYLRFSFIYANVDVDAIVVNEGTTALDNTKLRRDLLPRIVETAINDVADLQSEVSVLDSYIQQAGNLFDYTTIIDGYSVDSSNGKLVQFSGYYTSDWIKVKPNTSYAWNRRHTIAFYNSEKEFISGIGSEDYGNVRTTPPNTEYVRFSCSHKSSAPSGVVMIQGDYVPQEYVGPALKIDDNLIGINKKYTLDISSIKLPVANLSSQPHNLCLIAVKIIQVNGKSPDYTGFLYLDRNDGKMYYSSVSPDNPVYIATWDSSLANGEECDRWQASISADGDIIFLRPFSRANPIIYPHDGYSNPYIVDLSNGIMPCGYLMNQSIVHFSDGSFVWGEYAAHSLEDEQNNKPRNIWHVSKPYNNPSNWVVAHRFKHVYYTSEISDEPDNEIGHIHAVNYDWYNNVTYCTTGDIDRHCRLWYSTDNGVTWQAVPNAVGATSGKESEAGQKWRFTNMLFTKDYIYWGTDSFRNRHNLCRISRGANGVADASTLTILHSLEMNIDTSMSQATYSSVLVRNPNGILFLDRTEPRTDGKLDIKFYSFDDDKVYICATLEKATTDIVTIEAEARTGLANQCVTIYQPESLDFVLCGGGIRYRPNSTALFNNSIANYVGALKLKVHEIGMSKT